MKDIYKTVKSLKTPDLIINRIWENILSGKLKPGDKLPAEKYLIEQFQVSKATLREAFQTLETYGHISRKRGPKGGTIILDIVPDHGISFLFDYIKSQNLSIDSFIEIRSLIDPLVAETAAKRITENGIIELKNHIKCYEIDFDKKKTSRIGWEFYILLAKISENIFFYLIEELLIRVLMDIEFSLGIDDLNGSGKYLAYNTNTFTQQKRISEAIINSNAELAKIEMTKLREEWAKTIKKLIKENKSII